MGAEQNMLGKQNHVDNIRRVCRKSLEEGHLHCFFGCEVGSHRQGFAAACTDAQTVLADALPSGWKASVPENYLSAWNESNSGAKLKKTKTAMYTLASPSLDPRLILHTFDVIADAAQLGDSHVLGHMLVGQLHIRTPSGKCPSIKTKQRLVEEAMTILQHVQDENDFLKDAAAVIVGTPT